MVILKKTTLSNLEKKGFDLSHQLQKKQGWISFIMQDSKSMIK
jgi:hypothetical protein